MGRVKKEKPFAIPSFGMLMTEVSNEERVQLDSVSQAMNLKQFIGKLVTNWCTTCSRWRFQFVSQERMKTVLSNETFLCTKCSTPVKLILDSDHTLLAS